MSYDLMIFDPSLAPKGESAFLDWYDQQTEWSEPHSYDDPAITTAPLRAWFMEVIKSFPPMNGPLAPPISDEENSYLTDYSIGQSVIYCAFSYSVSAEGYEKCLSLAKKHRVGFFEASESPAEIILPENS